MTSSVIVLMHAIAGGIVSWAVDGHHRFAAEPKPLVPERTPPTGTDADRPPTRGTSAQAVGAGTNAPAAAREHRRTTTRAAHPVALLAALLIACARDEPTLEAFLSGEHLDTLTVVITAPPGSVVSGPQGRVVVPEHGTLRMVLPVSELDTAADGSVEGSFFVDIPDMPRTLRASARRAGTTPADSRAIGPAWGALLLHEVRGERSGAPEPGDLRFHAVRGSYGSIGDGPMDHADYTRPPAMRTVFGIEALPGSRVRVGDRDIELVDGRGRYVLERARLVPDLRLPGTPPDEALLTLPVTVAAPDGAAHEGVIVLDVGVADIDDLFGPLRDREPLSYGVDDGGEPTVVALEPPRYDDARPEVRVLGPGRTVSSVDFVAFGTETRRNVGVCRYFGATVRREVIDHRYEIHEARTGRRVGVRSVAADRPSCPRTLLVPVSGAAPPLQSRPPWDRSVVAITRAIR